MIIRIKKIEHVVHAHIVGLAQLIISVAVSLGGLIWYKHGGGVPSTVMVVVGMAMMYLDEIFNPSKVWSAVLAGMLSHEIPGECEECGSPVKDYGFKVKLYPDTAIIRYTCGSERTICIDNDDKNSNVLTINEVTKLGVCSAPEQEDII